MSDVIEWLESPAGEEWSKSVHHCAPIYLASVKPDDPLETNWYREFEFHVWLR